MRCLRQAARFAAAGISATIGNKRHACPSELPKCMSQDWPLRALPMVLASTSPRRQALLHALGLDFTAHAANIDETPLPNELPAALAQRLAVIKARAVSDALGEPALIIAADTVVALDDALMCKPLDAAEARAMLVALRGRDHHVVTAISVFDNFTGIQRTVVNDTLVTMRPYTNDEIDGYIATGDPFDKAGGYAIQHPTFRPVAAINGCFASVMGLPLADLRGLLAEFGVSVATALPPICRTQGAIACCQAG